VLPDTYLPQFHLSTRVGEQTRDWWMAIGQSLMQFTEIEQLVIDWTVRFSGDRSLWKAKFMDDLKALLPALRKSLQQAGSHRLSRQTRDKIGKVLSDLEALNQPRNDIAHMRLLLKLVPLQDSEHWIPSASHVVVRKRDGQRLVLAHRDLRWIRSTVKAAKNAGKAFHAQMLEVWNELQASRVSRSRTLHG
jgi:hypothetical protein